MNSKQWLDGVGVEDNETGCDEVVPSIEPGASAF